MSQPHEPLKPGESRPLFVDGPAGRIEALLAAPKATARGLCLVCHPHPQYGGAMSNKVVYGLASCALQAGLLTARFNFRGVGRSEGAYGEVRGEIDDALAVIEWLRPWQPAGAPLVLAGFSFGAYVSLAAAASARPAVQLSVSIPLGSAYLEQAGSPPHPGCPWLALHSRDDEVVGYEQTRAALEGYNPRPELFSVDGAGHFWHGRLGDIQQAVLPFLQRHLPA